MAHKTFHVFVFVGTAILWSGCCATTSLGHNCLKAESGSAECIWQGVPQKVRADQTDGAYQGQLGKTERLGGEKLSETSRNELSGKVSFVSPSTAATSTAYEPIFLLAVFMSCCSIIGLMNEHALFGRLRGQCSNSKSMHEEAFAEDLRTLKQAKRRMKSIAQEVKRLRALEEVGEETEGLDQAAFDFVLKNLCSKASMDVAAQTDIPVIWTQIPADDVEPAGHAISFDDMDSVVASIVNSVELSIDLRGREAYEELEMNVDGESELSVELAGHTIPPDMLDSVVAAVVNSVELSVRARGREAYEELEQNADWHFPASLPAFCDITQASEASEVHGQERDSHPTHPHSRSSWVSNTTDSSDVICNDFGAALITEMLEVALNKQSTESSHDICEDSELDKASDCLVINSHAPETSDESCEVDPRREHVAEAFKGLDLETDSHPHSRSSWVSNTTESSDAICIDFATALITELLEETLDKQSTESSHDICMERKRDKASDCLIVDFHPAEISDETCELDPCRKDVVLAQNEAQLPIRKGLVVDTDAKEALQSRLAEIPSPVRRRRPSASFESPSPVRRRRPSASFESPSPARHRAASPLGTHTTVVPDSNSRDEMATAEAQHLDAVAEEEARDATAALFHLLLGDHAAPGTMSKQADCQSVPEGIEQATASVDCQPVERGQSRAHALDSAASTQMDRIRRNSLLRSPESWGSLSPSAAMEVPSEQMERIRRNSRLRSPASWGSAAVIDASAFAAGESEYQEPEAGSTRKLKDFFNEKLETTCNAENRFGQTPPRTNVVASATDFFQKRMSMGASPVKKSLAVASATDFFEKRMSMGNAPHVCEKSPIKKSPAIASAKQFFEKRMSMGNSPHVCQQSPIRKSHMAERAAEQRAVDKVAAEKAAAEKEAGADAAAEKAVAATKATVEKATAEKAAMEKAAAKKVAVGKAVAEKVAAIKAAAAEKVAAELRFQENQG